MGKRPNGPAPAQIPPGHSLDGFSIVSSYPPGYVRSYVKGFAPVPYIPDSLSEGTFDAPDDTTDSQRGWVLGPTRYTVVIDDGNRRPGVDGFLGFMSLGARGTTLASPAPVALKLSLHGETVYRETFHATLNGADVTGAFHPGPSDGADLVAVFRIGDSPLVAGKNVLVTSIDGLVPGTTRRATDTDRMVFTVTP